MTKPLIRIFYFLLFVGTYLKGVTQKLKKINAAHFKWSPVDNPFAYNIYYGPS